MNFKNFIKAMNFILLLLSFFIISCNLFIEDELEFKGSEELNNSKLKLKKSIPLIEVGDLGLSSIIYIDNSLSHSCDDYDISTRSCGNGNKKAFKSISESSSAAAPGVNFQIRGGDYKEPLHISTSGTETAYLAYTAYSGETVTLKNTKSNSDGEDYGPIWLDQVSYVLVREIDVTQSIGFGRLLNSHHNIIDSCDFDESSIWKGGSGASKRGGLYVSFSDYNRIINNRFYKGTDSLAIIKSNHNLVAGNTMDLAGHDVWNIKCGSFNVVRNNEFSNKNQKLGSVFDCEKATMSWHGNGEFSQESAILDASKHNLIDNNIFRDAVKYYSTSGGNGIQYAGQNGIIRRNLFYRLNAGIGMAGYSSEATYNYSNRVYNNTFHDNWCVAIALSSPKNKMTDNKYINNILWNNQGLSQEQCADKSAKQILFRARNNNEESFINNNIASEKGSSVLGLWGSSSSYTLDEYQYNVGTVNFVTNLELDPLFVDELSSDYNLKSSSPMIDKGAYLSKILSASGSGTKIKLSDVNYFYDGFGIKGEKGDTIQIEGKTKTAVITKIDYRSKTITVNQELTWRKGDGIALKYNGTRPDIGALEY